MLGRLTQARLLVACAACNQAPVPARTASADVFAAAQAGRVDEIHRLSKLRMSINELDQNGYSPLMLAVSNGHLPAAKALVENGADYRIKHPSGANLLILAVGVPKGEIAPIIDPRSCMAALIFEKCVNFECYF